ncbi:MAG: replication initiation protein [Ruminococcus sp.]|nr:replication initiation protein [Ruminococcus sp.]
MKKKRKKDKSLSEKIKVLENLINDMTISEKRFFTVYLAKINSEKNSDGNIEFSFEDFCEIMDIEKENNNYFRRTINILLNKIVEIPEENNYNRTAHIFSDCGIYRNQNNKLFLSFNSNNNILPLLTDFSEYYFKNHFWNYFFLKSENQIRMYKLMKRYLNIGMLEIDVAELKSLLGLRPEEYRRFDSFRIRVLDACQKSLSENTDILYTYKMGKSDKKGKWISIIFYIKENKQFIEKLHFSKFV